MGSYQRRLAEAREHTQELTDREMGFPNLWAACLSCSLSSRVQTILRDWPYLIPGLSGIQFQIAHFSLAYNSKLHKSNEVKPWPTLRAFLHKYTTEFVIQPMIVVQRCVAVYLQGK